MVFMRTIRFVNNGVATCESPISRNTRNERRYIIRYTEKLWIVYVFARDVWIDSAEDLYASSDQTSHHSFGSILSGTYKTVKIHSLILWC